MSTSISRVVQRRDIRLPDNVNWRIISKRAGTREKALLEAIMNSIDAGATMVEIAVEATSFAIVDDGRGFTDHVAIQTFFAKFGTPQKAGDATFGAFRFGRGQIFAFSANTWRTGAFRMSVDVKKNGASYDLEEALEPIAGCRIDGEWYDPMPPEELRAVLHQIKELAAHTSIPVLLNGRQVSSQPQDLEWDLETDDAWIRFTDTGGLLVYNQGVFVREYPAFQYGTAGVVVSKRSLQVNFARNDILTQDCVVWRRLAKLIRSKAQERLEKTVRLTDDERKAIARSFATGEITCYAARAIRFITDITGRTTTIEAFHRNHRTIALAPSGDSHLAEIAHGRKLAYVLSRETLDQFQVDTIESLIKIFARRWNEDYRHEGHWKDIKIVPFAQIAEGLDVSNELIEDKALTRKQRAALLAIRGNLNGLVTRITEGGHLDGDCSPREIRAGRSETNDSWTDGSTYIALNMTILKHVADAGTEGFIDAVHILVHELLHGATSRGSHSHTSEFYETYHAIVTDWRNRIVARTARYMFLDYLSKLRSFDKAPLERNASDEASILDLDRVLADLRTHSS
jgi:hypothetical protein